MGWACWSIHLDQIALLSSCPNEALGQTFIAAAWEKLAPELILPLNLNQSQWQSSTDQKFDVIKSYKMKFKSSVREINILHRKLYYFGQHFHQVFNLLALKSLGSVFFSLISSKTSITIRLLGIEKFTQWREFINLSQKSILVGCRKLWGMWHSTRRRLHRKGRLPFTAAEICTDGEIVEEAEMTQIGLVRLI